MIGIDWASRAITVPQGDLDYISGSLYELDTDWFRLQLKDLEDDPDGMVCPRTHDHNSKYSVAGTTYAQKVEIINGYTVEFEDGAYSVRLVGSNNNIWDIEGGVLIRNQVQVIPSNAAGLIVTETVDIQAAAAVVASAVWQALIEGDEQASQTLRLMRAALAGKTAIEGDVFTARDRADTKDRITATTTADGQRTAVTTDAD